jgi:ureidoglycolate lyase
MANVAMHRHVLRIEPLTAEAFKPFGEVIEAGAAAPHYTINEGYAERYNALARIDAGLDGGLPILSIFRAVPRVLPFRLSLIERHRLGSQAFVPMAAQRFLVVVAEAGPLPHIDQLRCFMATAGQGVNYSRGTWHHPLLAIDAGGDFLVIDRSGPGAAQDCEERSLGDDDVWIEG